MISPQKRNDNLSEDSSTCVDRSRVSPPLSEAHIFSFPLRLSPLSTPSQVLYSIFTALDSSRKTEPQLPTVLFSFWHRAPFNLPSSRAKLFIAAKLAQCQNLAISSSRYRKISFSEPNRERMKFDVFRPRPPPFPLLIDITQKRYPASV